MSAANLKELSWGWSARTVAFLLIGMTLHFSVAAQKRSSSPTDSLRQELRRAGRGASGDSARSVLFALLAEAYYDQGAFDSTVRAARAGAEASERARNYSAYAQNLIALSKGYVATGKIEAAHTPSMKAATWAKRAGDNRLLTRAWLNHGDYFAANKQALRALVAYDTTVRVARAANAPDLAAEAHLNRALIFSQMSKTNEALAEYDKALEQARKSGSMRLQGLSYVRMGALLRKMQKNDRAVERFQQAVDLFDSCRCAAGLHVEALSSLGSIKLMFGDTALSRSYHHKALKMARRSKTARELAYAYHGLGDYYLRVAKYDSSEHYLNRAEPLAQRTSEFDLYNRIINDKITLYTALRQFDKAQQASEKGQQLASATNQIDLMLAAQENRFKADSAEGNYLAAMQHQQRMYKYRDSVQKVQRANEVRALMDRIKRNEEKARQEMESLEREAALQTREWLLVGILLVLILLSLLTWNVFRGRKKERQANAELRILYEQVQNQKSEIEAQNAEITAINAAMQGTLDEVHRQHNALEEQSLKIEDSLRYASRIQQAILPSERLLDAHLPRHFIYYRPRDIVSGDFYWMTRIEGRTVLAAVDCTGHGVPGAFMSVLGYNLMNQIVDENGIHRPEAILATLDRRITGMLRQQFAAQHAGVDEDGSKDGMDVALIALHDPQPDGRRLLEFAGAGRPLWRLSRGKIIEYKSAKYPCGGSQHDQKTFPAQSIVLEPGDRLYIFSDGVPDQFGGPMGRKMGSQRLQEFLIETGKLTVARQGEAFTKFFEDWMGSRRQIDDVLFIGIGC